MEEENDEVVNNELSEGTKKAPKKIKKSKTLVNDDEAQEVDNQDESSLKDKKKKRKLDGDENGTSEEKKLKKKKKADGNAEVTVTEEIIPRKRTRSMSENEDVFIPSQSPEEFRQENQITISGHTPNGTGEYICPAPMISFDSTPFALPIRRAFDAAGFLAPTLTQAQAWPIALSGRDVITVAKTGSGKTCGFLLPAFHMLLSQSREARRGQPGILVLAPTRELACQIEEECVRFGRSSNIRSTCAYGGSPKSLQIRKIQAGLDVIIATPGRLNDLLEMGVVKLDKVTFLVLDEADRMLDMGFEPQIRSIIATIPKARQSMMFSATWPREVQKLAREFMNDPIEVKFGDVNSLNANKSIQQVIKVLNESDKSETLKAVMKEIHPDGTPETVPKTIIFLSRKYACDGLANELWELGYAVDSLHGDKQQFMRTKVMDQFKRGELRILVATDVAARGLDVKDIAVVINYDFPAGQSGVEDYVHRIGRTGRAGAQGKAYTFFTKDDSKRASELIGVLTRAEQVVPEELRRFGGWGGGGGGRGGFQSGIWIRSRWGRRKMGWWRWWKLGRRGQRKFSKVVDEE